MSIHTAWPSARQHFPNVCRHNVCNTTNHKLENVCNRDKFIRQIPNLNTYQYGDILAPAQNIIANLTIIGQHGTRPGSSWSHSGLTQVACASARPDSESLGPAGLWVTLNLKSTCPGLLWAVHDLPVPAPSRGRRASALNLKSTCPGLLWAILDLPVPGLADSEARTCYSVTSMTRVALRHWHCCTQLVT